ncbi:hypothetical protein AAVH_19800 [Aphelenchoides avenae]|nr:hypothetical protein AAVH_19800 [Aphelenchus avenae]
MEPAHAGSGIWLLESEGELIYIADVLPTRCNSQRPSRSNPRRMFREPLLFNTDAESHSGYRTVITIPAYIYPGFEALGVDEPNGIVREMFSPFVDRIVIPDGERDVYRSNLLYEVGVTSYRSTRDNPNGGWVALTPTTHKTREKFSPLPLSENIAQNYAQSRLFKWVPVKGVVLKSVLDYHVIVAAQGHGQRAYLARDSGITDGDLVSFSSVTVKFDGAVRHVAANCRMIKPDYLKRLPSEYYEKAFDTIETNAVLNALEAQGVHRRYIDILEDVYDECDTHITLFDKPITIPIRRGVRQGDTISPKLFTAALEMIFRDLRWEERRSAGINIDGKRLTHLRFADDIVLVGSSRADVQKRLEELNERSNAVGLRINKEKTEWLEYFRTNERIYLEGEEIRRTKKTQTKSSLA